MKRWKLVALLGATSLISAAAGAFSYRALTVESAEFVAQQQQVRAAQHKLDNTLSDGAKPAAGADEGGPALHGATTFALQSKGMSNVTFTSDAPLESIVGNTTTTTGDITVDLSDLGKTRGTVAVDLRTLKTGIDLRDEHLRGAKFLDTEKFPQATFKLTRVEYDGKPVLHGAKKHVTLHGDISIRGVRKTIAVPARVVFYRWSKDLKEVYIEGDVLRIDGQIDVTLADFGIDAGSLMGKKVANLVTIALKLTATTAAPTLTVDTQS